jgi:hypothetical protein
MRDALRNQLPARADLAAAAISKQAASRKHTACSFVAGRGVLSTGTAGILPALPEVNHNPTEL